MLKGTLDLHLHTICSDGLDTPEDIVAVSLEGGYEAIALTDHDSVAGVKRALDAAEGTDLTIVPGIELSTSINAQELHILGYFIDYQDEEFLKKITFFKEKRRERAEEITHYLNRLGLDLKFETILRIAHGAPLGRPHIAEALLSEELVSTYEEAFHRYIGFNGPAYVPKYKVEPKEGIELILSVGGVPVFAHPGVYGNDGIIPELIDYGLKGVEAIHPLHTVGMQMRYRELCRKYGIVYTGGSDWHGIGRGRESISHHKVPREVLDELWSRSSYRKNAG